MIEGKLKFKRWISARRVSGHTIIPLRSVRGIHIQYLGETLIIASIPEAIGEYFTERNQIQ